MNNVFIALGSNLGDRLGYLTRALNHLSSFGTLREVGYLYRSEAYGYLEQAHFYNSAVLLETKLAPVALLNILKKIEKQLGRKKRIRWGPREIDLDIIFFNRQLVQVDGLTIPHPDFHNRRFVLQPIADIAPDFQPLPRLNTVLQFLEQCTDTTKIKRISTKWYAYET
ncbi:MAG TPA: 2-amino-4-hydroxy-6-hydroxymethyldihydropteridine diphosphokinase [Caldithrix sp.]|nr:2-amino-4-hydroxy-6-hydroxymethyldihydropteridine diphosphokinase [Caldithrix sp.]